MKIRFLLFLLLSIVFLGCAKDAKKIRYRVISQSKADVLYRMNGGSIRFEQVSGDWSKTFRSRPGTPIYLSGTKTSPFGKLNILVYIDDVLTHSLITDEMFETMLIETTVP